MGGQRSRNNKGWWGCPKWCKAEHKSKSQLLQCEEYLLVSLSRVYVYRCRGAAVRVSCPAPVDTPHLFNCTGPVNGVFLVAPMVHECKNIISKTMRRIAQDLTQQKAVAIVRIIFAIDGKRYFRVIDEAGFSALQVSLCQPLIHGLVQLWWRAAVSLISM